MPPNNSFNVISEQTEDATRALVNANQQINTVPSEVIGGVDALNLPSIPSLGVQLEQNVISQAGQIGQQAQANIEALQQQRTGASNRIQQLSQSLPSQAQFLQQELDLRNVSVLEKELQDLTADITSRSNALTAQGIQDQQAVEDLVRAGGAGAGTLRSFAVGEQARLDRDLQRARQADALQLTALVQNAQLLQGNAQQARTAAEQMAQLKFSDAKNSIDAEIDFLNRLREDTRQELTTQQEELRFSREQSLQAQRHIISQLERQDEIKFNLKEQAASLGAGRQLLDSLDNSQSVDEMQELILPIIAQRANEEFARIQAGEDRANALFELQKTAAGLDNQLKEMKLAELETQLPQNNDEAAIKRQKLIQSVLEVRDHARLEDAVGVRSVRGLLGQVFRGTQVKEFQSKFDQLRAQLTLESLSALQGFGQISDTEFNTAKDAATSLNIKLSNKDFKRILDDMISEFPPEEVEALRGGFNIRELNEINALTLPNSTSAIGQ